MKAAELITDAVAEEKGNIAYGFSKVGEDYDQRLAGCNAGFVHQTAALRRLQSASR